MRVSRIHVTRIAFRRMGKRTRERLYAAADPNNTARMVEQVATIRLLRKYCPIFG